MWISSDPLVVQERLDARKHCTFCNEIGSHTRRICPKERANSNKIVNPLFKSNNV